MIPINWDIWRQNNPVPLYYEDLIAIKDLKDVTVSNSDDKLELGFSQLGLDSLGSVELRNKL